MSQTKDSAGNFKARFPDHTETNIGEAVRFLTSIAHHETIFVGAFPVERNLAVRYQQFDITDPESVKAMRSFISFLEVMPGFNIFYQANVSVFANRVPTTDDVRMIRLVVLDFDPDKSKALDAERDRLRQVAHDLVTGPLQPRAIVDTGGGMQVVYELMDPIPVEAGTIEEIEILMKSLARSLGADTATCTARNLFRVPGTRNWPTAAKKAAGRDVSVSGLWHSGGPRTTLAELRSLATVAADDGPASAPVEFDDLGEDEVRTVLDDPAALPGYLIDMLRDPILQKAISRPPPVGDTSGGDFYLACTLARLKIAPRDIALLLTAYGHKVAVAFDQGRLFSYVVHTVQKAVGKVRIEGLLDDFEEDAEGAEERKREHRARLKPLTIDEALEDLFSENHVDLVQGLMRRGELMVFYGKPGAGKTFVVLDLSFHIALGRAWNERTVKPGRVVYIATESPLGIRYRVKALSDKLGKPDNFMLICTTVNMFDPRVDLGPLMAELKQLGQIDLIVIDTLARTMVGGNENSTQDMSRLIANGDMLRDKFGAAIAWVHHTGKNEAAGARGSSALVAATDTEIEISDLCFRSTKMRDREHLDYRFKLHPVGIGSMPDGTEVTSCTVDWFQASAMSGSTTENQNLQVAIDLLRMQPAHVPMTVRELFADAESFGRKFPGKQESVKRALDRACESDVHRVFTRVEDDRRAANNKKQFRYGLVEW